MKRLAASGVATLGVAMSAGPAPDGNPGLPGCPKPGDPAAMPVRCGAPGWSTPWRRAAPRRRPSSTASVTVATSSRRVARTRIHPSIHPHPGTASPPVTPVMKLLTALRRNRSSTPASLALVPLLLCAWHPSAPAQPVQPGDKFPWQQLEVRAPASPGWVLIAASRQNLAFMRRSDELARSEVATVSVFKLPEPLDRDGFRTWVEQAVKAELPASRFRPVEHNAEHDDARGHDCVVHRSVSHDLQARPLPPGGDPPLLQQVALYCRHPDRAGTGFAAAFSTRGSHYDNTLQARARDFVEGIVATAPASTATR